MAKAHPSIQLIVEVGLASERHDPIALACPLEALRVQGEGAPLCRDEERPAIRVHRERCNVCGLERQVLGEEGPGPCLVFVGVGRRRGAKHGQGGVHQHVKRASDGCQDRVATHLTAIGVLAEGEPQCFDVVHGEVCRAVGRHGEYLGAMCAKKPQAAVMALEAHDGGVWEGLRRLVQVGGAGVGVEGVDVYLADAVPSLPVIHYEIEVLLLLLLRLAPLGRGATWLKRVLPLQHIFLLSDGRRTSKDVRPSYNRERQNKTDSEVVPEFRKTQISSDRTRGSRSDLQLASGGGGGGACEHRRLWGRRAARSLLVSCSLWDGPGWISSWSTRPSVRPSSVAHHNISLLHSSRSFHLRRDQIPLTADHHVFRLQRRRNRPLLRLPWRRRRPRLLLHGRRLRDGQERGGRRLHGGHASGARHEVHRPRRHGRSARDLRPHHRRHYLHRDQPQGQALLPLRRLRPPLLRPRLRPRRTRRRHGHRHRRRRRSQGQCAAAKAIRWDDPHPHLCRSSCPLRPHRRYHPLLPCRPISRGLEVFQDRSTRFCHCILFQRVNFFLQTVWSSVVVLLC